MSGRRKDSEKSCRGEGLNTIPSPAALAARRVLRRWARPLLVLALMLVGVWQAWHLGGEYAASELRIARWELENQEAKLAELDRTNAELQARIAILERAGQIDSEAYGEVVNTLRDLESQILEQREELAFYRGIVSPEQTRSGLRIQSLELTPGAAPGHFRYSLLLTQVRRNDRAVRGSAEISVQGNRQGAATTLPLAEISRPERERWKFRFRYFQSLDGELQLPEGFEPDTIEVEVQPEGKGNSRLTRTFGWPE